MRRVEKVVAYVTRDGALLVFDHPDAPEVGVQVPAGTIETGETPLEAVLREIREETGLSEFAAPVYLGSDEFDMSVAGKDELHCRHFFSVELRQAAPMTWRHQETSGGTANPVTFAFRWVPIGAAPDLSVGQGAMLDHLARHSR